MVKGTQEKIINSFFKLAERYPERSSFSITEIANEAKISRQAIYQKHFKRRTQSFNRSFLFKSYYSRII